MLQKRRWGLWGIGCLLAVVVWSGCSEVPLDWTAMARSSTVHAAKTPKEQLDSLFTQHILAGFWPQDVDQQEAEAWADSVLQTLSLEAKLGQLFIVHLLADANREARLDNARDLVEKEQVGGFIVPRLMAPQTVFEATRTLQATAKLPLFFAADYERGVGRFDNTLTDLPANMAIGATRDTLWAAAAGRLTAIESRAVGVNWLFAPVVDVNNNPDNPIINIRSYGEDPVLVAEMAGAFVHEAERYGVLTTLKHFPGHGNTAVDSHTSMGTIRGTKAELAATELYPFRSVLAQPNPPGAVMTAHLWVPAYERRALPATFSRTLLTDVLRDSLGFQGLVVTDDIKMGALRGTWSLAERTVRSLQAGADVVLTPENIPRAKQAVRAALQRGTLRQAQIDRSVRRILLAKAHLGLHRTRQADPADFAKLTQRPLGQPISDAIAAQTVTLLKTHPVLPLVRGQRLAVIQFTNYDGAASIEAAMDSLAQSLRLAPGETHLELGREPTAEEVQAALAMAKEAEVVVLPLFLRLQSGRGDAGLFPKQEALMTQLLALGRPVILITLGNPYAVTAYQTAQVHLVAYDQSLGSVHAVAGVLRGYVRPLGKLPVAVMPYPVGHGLSAAY